MSLTRDLIDRRVPQYLALYIGAGWGLVQFIAFIEERYLISPHWTDLCLLVLALLLPSVLIWTYNHGRPGQDRLRASDKVGIPANFALAAVVVWLVFGGKDLGAMTHTLAAEDDEGNRVERVVPKAEYRKRLGVFTPAAPGDSASDWLGDALAVGVSSDLIQDAFIDLRYGPFFTERLRRAGFEPGQPVPLALQRTVAREMHLSHFLTGRVEPAADGVRATIDLYRASNGQRVTSRSYEAGDVLALADSVSLGVRRDLGLPDAHLASVADLPVSERLTSSTAAFRRYVEGLRRMMRGDWQGAEPSFVQALEIDPTFAMAALDLFSVRLFTGNAAEAVPALRTAMDHIYRIPERLHFAVNANHHMMRGEHDRALEVLETGSALYPEDIQLHLMRAQLYMVDDRNRASIDALQEVLALDASQVEHLRSIGELWLDEGEYDSALVYYGHYSEADPGDAEVQTAIGKAYSLRGQHDRARAAYEQALTLEPSSVETRVALARLAIAVGEAAEARRQIAEAAAAARTAHERSLVARTHAELEEWRGRYGAALEHRSEMLHHAVAANPPLIVAVMELATLDNYVYAGRAADAQRVLERLETRLAGPYAAMGHLGRVQMELARAAPDPTRLESSAAQMSALIEQQGFAMLEPHVVNARARAAELRGRHDEALRLYARQLELDPTEVDPLIESARVLRSMGRQQEAERSAREALRVRPGDPEARMELGLALLAQRRRADARAELERAAAIWADAEPAFHPAQRVREQLAAVTGTRSD
mgnify:CR=1 FL=1